MADEHAKALHALNQTARPLPSASREYDFEQLGGHLADVMASAADDMVSEAQQLAEQTRLLAADIRAQVNEHSKLLRDINTRLKLTGEQMLEAHRKFNGGA
jgi:hypothetical protein